MTVRLRLLWLEMKMGLLVPAFAAFSGKRLVLALLYVPVLFSWLWVLDEGRYFGIMLCFAFILFGAAAVRKILSGSDAPCSDPPLILPLDSMPALNQIVAEAAVKFGKTPPRSAAAAIVPVPWRPFGSDLTKFRGARAPLPLPLCCLQLWSISEMEAYVARTLVLRPGPQRLLALVRRTAEGLASDLYQAELQGAKGPAFAIGAKMLESLLRTAEAWLFLADLEADARTAGGIGPQVVMSLACKTELARAMAPDFVATYVEPALEKGVLIPIAEAFAAYANALDPHWKQALDRVMRETEASEDRQASALAIRMAALSSLPNKVAVSDPRAAAALVENLEALERRVLQNELGAERVTRAKRVGMKEWSEFAILPRLKDETQRNQVLLAGKNPSDIPSMLRDLPALSGSYSPEPGRLLDPSQKEERVRYLLGAFLALALLEKHWRMEFDFAEGVILISGDRRIHPFTLVDSLGAGTISEEEFLTTIAS